VEVLVRDDALDAVEVKVGRRLGRREYEPRIEDV
jgi:hypothetical protein